MDWILMSGHYEHSIELPGFIKHTEFIDQVNTCMLLKNAICS